METAPEEVVDTDGPSVVPDRLSRMREVMADADVDVAMLTPGPTFAWLTDLRPQPFERLYALVVRADGPTTLVVPDFDSDLTAASSIADIEALGWNDAKGPREALRHALDAKGSRVRLGIDAPQLTVNYLQLAKDVNAGIELKDVSSELSAARLVKDRDEIERIRAAGALLDRVMQRIIETFQVGMTERALALKCKAMTLEEGGDRLAFDPIVLAAGNAALPHGHPGDIAIERGDLLLVDLGVERDGYCADLTRTFAVGGRSEWQREVHQLVADAQASALDAVHPGCVAGDIDQAARGVFEQAGLEAAYITRTGHGIGVDVHEPPSLHASSEDELPLGAVITIEPGLYFPDMGAVRIEDDVAVAEDGANVLTTTSRDLVELG